MQSSTPEQDYLSALRNRVPKEHPIHQMLREPYDGCQRVSYFDFEHPSSQADHLETLFSWTDELKGRAVCVIENICGSPLSVLLGIWIPPSSSSIQAASKGLLCGTVSCEVPAQRTVRPLPFGTHTSKAYCRISSEAALKHNRAPRRHEYDRRYGWQATTRVSYYRVSEHLCKMAFSYLRTNAFADMTLQDLFLVDPPFARGESDSRWLQPSKLGLWAPYSRNRGGLPIPQLYGMTMWAPFELLQSFLCLSSHSTVLFEAQYDPLPQTPVATGPVILSQFLAASLWRSNIDLIDQDLKVTAFRDLRRPNIRTNNRFHELREDLNTLRTEATLAKDWLFDDGRYPNRFHGRAPGSGRSRVEWPADMLGDILEHVPQTECFLMDTFQLLMSSISVLESQNCIQDARRSALLTQLAAIYVPLSFVTGIWGTNIQEINDSPHPLWIFGVTLVIAVAVTVVGLLTLRYWEEFMAFFRRRGLAPAAGDGDFDTSRSRLEQVRRTHSKLA